MAAALVLAALVCVGGAGAQMLGAPAPSDPRYLDSRERAERDWELLTRSAADLWGAAETALGTIYAGALVMALAAAMGGYFGAGMRRRRGAEPETPSRPVAPERSMPPERPAPEAAAPSFMREPGASMRPTGSADPAAADAARLFDYFRERFGVEDASADAAIDYLTRLGDSIEGLRRRLADAERRAETARPMGGGPTDPTAMLLGDATRVIRNAMQTLRGDRDFNAFARAVSLEQTARGLAALRGALQEEGGYPPDAAAELMDDPWPHALLRADALLSTYYPTRGPWLDLRMGASAAAAGLRLLLRQAGVDVAFVRMLSLFDSAADENWSVGVEQLATLAPVRWMLLADGKGGAGRENAVIDVENFGYVDRRRGVTTRSKLILYSEDAWRAPEWR